MKVDKTPYYMGAHEEWKTYSQLSRYLIQAALGNKNTTKPLTSDMAEEQQLFSLGYQNVLRTSASSEALNFLYDTAPWRHLIGNDNAALLTSIHLGNEQSDIDTDWTLDGGLQTLTGQLMHRFLNASSRHAFFPNHRLACIREPYDYHPNVFQLIFVKTDTVDDRTRDTRESKAVCARNVILAIPPQSLKKIEWKPYDKTSSYRALLDSVRQFPVLRIYFTYNAPWWWGSRPLYEDVVTDLPIRRIQYLGAGYNEMENATQHVWMVTETEGRDMDYFHGLMQRLVVTEEHVFTCTDNTPLIRDVNRQVARIFGMQEEGFPQPVQVLIEDWASDDRLTGSWYVWRRGVLWNRVANHPIQPIKGKQVYMASPAFCPGTCQLSAEGVLQRVNAILDKYMLPTTTKDNDPLEIPYS